MYFTEKKGGYEVGYDNVFECLNYFKEVKDEEGFLEKAKSVAGSEAKDILLRSKHDYFMGFSNIEMLLEELKKDMEGRYQAVEIAEEVEIENEDLFDLVPNSRRRTVRRLEDGDEIDVDRYLEREVNCFESSLRYESQKKPIMTLYVGNQASCGWGEEDFKNREAVVYTVLSLCEKLGINSEVICERRTIKHFVNSPKFVDTKIMIKEAGTPLNPSTITFICGSLAFTRNFTLVGAIVNAVKNIKEKGLMKSAKIRYGFGNSVDIPHEDLGKNEFVLRTFSPYGFTKENAIKEINRFIAFLKGRLVTPQED